MIEAGDLAAVGGNVIITKGWRVMLSKQTVIAWVIGIVGVFFLLDAFGSASISDAFARVAVVAVVALFLLYRIGKHREGYEKLIAAGVAVDGKPSLRASCYVATTQQSEVRYRLGSYTGIQRIIRELPAGTPHQWGHLDAVSIYRTPQELTRGA